MYDVFVSYRRDAGSDIARLVKVALENKGLKVFLDIDNLNRGYFDEKLLNYIETTANFLIVLSKTTLDRTTDPKDWVRREIEHAVGTKRNILPIFVEGFTPPHGKKYPQVIDELMRHNGVQYSHVYFSAMIKTIIDHLDLKTDQTRPRQKSIPTPNNNERPIAPAPEKSGPILTIGRGEHVDIKVADSTVSTEHMTMQLIGKQARICDCNSTNGVFVTQLGKQRISQQIVDLDTEILLGNFRTTPDKLLSMRKAKHQSPPSQEKPQEPFSRYLRCEDGAFQRRK